jgi:hypothetical protein
MEILKDRFYTKAALLAKMGASWSFERISCTKLKGLGSTSLLQVSEWLRVERQRRVSVDRLCQDCWFLWADILVYIGHAILYLCGRLYETSPPATQIMKECSERRVGVNSP